ncbi:MAG: hypothetical protein NVSMB12_13310 [Acidimicrobiales bacterium]
MVAEREQRRHVVVGEQPYVAAVAAVAAVRSPARDVGLSAHRHRTGATVTGADVDLGLVDERTGAGHGFPAYGTWIATEFADKTPW